jgi:hypothetical protein
VNRRPRRSTAAVLTALVLLAACVLVAIDAIQILVRQRPMVSYPSFAHTLHRLHWNGVAVEIAGVALAVIGVLLLLVACLPGRPTMLALSDEAREGELPPSGLSRHGLRNMLRATAADVDGVTTAKLTVRRKVVAASVHSAGPPGDLADNVRGALEQRLDQIAPARRPALRVRASAKAAS